MGVYAYIEHLFTETGFPVHAIMITAVIYIIYLCRKDA